jgi:hypothetical protein
VGYIPKNSSPLFLGSSNTGIGGLNLAGDIWVAFSCAWVCLSVVKANLLTLVFY